MPVYGYRVRRTNKLYTSYDVDSFTSQLWNCGVVPKNNIRLTKQGVRYTDLVSLWLENDKYNSNVNSIFYKGVKPYHIHINTKDDTFDISLNRDCLPNLSPEFLNVPRLNLTNIKDEVRTLSEMELFIDKRMESYFTVKNTYPLLYLLLNTIFTVPGIQFSTAYRSGRWDGFKRFHKDVFIDLFNSSTNFGKCEESIQLTALLNRMERTYLNDYLKIQENPNAYIWNADLPNQHEFKSSLDTLIGYIRKRACMRQYLWYSYILKKEIYNLLDNYKPILKSLDKTYGIHLNPLRKYISYFSSSNFIAVTEILGVPIGFLPSVTERIRFISRQVITDLSCLKDEYEHGSPFLTRHPLLSVRSSSSVMKHRTTCIGIPVANGEENAYSLLKLGFLDLISTSNFIHLTMDKDGCQTLPRSMKSLLGKESVSFEGLYEYQKDAIKNALTRKLTLDKEYFFPRGVFHHDPSAGKTYEMRQLCQILPKPVLIMCFSSVVLERIKDLMSKETDFKVTTVYAKNKDLSGDIIIGLPQSLKNMQRKVISKGILSVLVDECHNISDTNIVAYKFLKKMKPVFLYGFTGTPSMGSGSREIQDAVLKSLFGGIIHTVEYDQLIDKDKIVPAEVLMVKVKSPQVDQSSKDWDYVRSKGVINNLEKNRVIVQDCIKRSVNRVRAEKTLVIVDLIEHGELLQNLLKVSGVKTELITGSTPDDLKSKIMYDYEVDVVVATKVFDEGLDINTISNIVLAGEGKSHARTFQRIGRGLRKREFKTKVHILDFYNTSHRYTETHSKSRIELYLDKKINYNVLSIKEYLDYSNS